MWSFCKGLNLSWIQLQYQYRYAELRLISLADALLVKKVEKVEEVDVEDFRGLGEKKKPSKPFKQMTKDELEAFYSSSGI